MYLEASGFDQPAIVGDGAKRLNGHSFPHQMRIVGGKLLVGDPIRESQSAIPSQYAKSFGQRLPWVGYVAKRFLADDGIHKSVLKWNAHDVSFDDPCFILKPDQLGQFLGT